MKIVGEMTEQLIFENKLQCAEIMALLKDRISKIKSRPIVAKKRPKAPAKFVREYHSGNEYTRSTLVVENDMSARLSVIMSVARQMIEYDRITKEDFLSLTKSYLDEHIIEEDV